MKQKLILSGILIAWLFAAIVVLSGCNVNKHITNTSTDSATVKKVDSASVNTSDISKSEGSSTSDSSGLEVNLYANEDTGSTSGKTKDTVSIKPNKEGGYDIESNVPIKSIKTHNNKSTEQHKTSDSAVTKVNTIHTSDSTHLIKQVAVKDVVKKSGWSLLDWVGIIVILGVCVYIAGRIYLYFNPEATGVFALLAGWRRKKEA